MKYDWKQIAGGLVLGLILGVAIGRWTLYKTHPRFAPPEKRHERVFKYFKKKLDLNPVQAEQISSILDNKLKLRQEIHNSVYPKFEEMHRSAYKEIFQVLNETQKLKYEKMHQKWQEKRKKRHQHHHHH